MTATLILTFSITAVVLWRLTVQYARARGSSLFVLSALPAALLILTASGSAGAWRIIRAFHDISSLGLRSETVVLQVCREVLGGLRLAAFGTLAALGTAALLQWRAAPADDSGDPEAISTRLDWQGWLLLVSPLLIIPTALLLLLTGGLPRYLVEVLVALRPSSAGSGGVNIGAFSSTISARLVAGVLGGLAVCGLHGGTTIGHFLVPQSLRLPAGLRTFAWISLGLTVAFLVWLVLHFSMELRMIDTFARQSPASNARAPIGHGPDGP